MRHRLARFSVAQTSKVLAVLYGALGLLFLPFFVASSLLGPEENRMGIGLALLFPVLYALLGYVFTAIGCAIYNVVARYVGGIEVEVQQVDEPSLG